MSNSMYLTIHFRSKVGENEFYVDLELAKKIFKYLWEKEGSGFDNDGNINGLLDYYLRSDWTDDYNKLEREKGKLKILQLESPFKNKYYSFNFHNYGDSGKTKLTEKTDLRDIYLLFAEILSTCFSYAVLVSDSSEDKEYSVFFDEDGRKYIMTDNRSDYIKLVRDFVYAKDSISQNTTKLEDTKKKLEVYKSNLESYNQRDNKRG